MGAKLLKYYAFVKQNGGMQMEMRLAMKTGLPSKKAEAAPDSPDNLAKFKAAIKEILGKEPPPV